MQKFPNDWTNLQKINYLQRRILLLSILYYDFDESPVSDKNYDEISKQLVELQKDTVSRGSQYWYAFHDFDGSTGFYLRDRLTPEDNEYLTKIARFGTNRVGNNRTNKTKNKKRKEKK